MISLSCNNEELFVEPVTEVIDEPVGDEEQDPEDTDDDFDATQPCDFTLDNIEPNSTIVINCILDLDGATVNLPANVTILYEGGDIINGSLVFSGTSVISGELLNSSLTLGGSSTQMKDPTFNFDPQRWGIVEGKTTSGIALRNRDILESIMIEAKDLGVTTFKIDAIDAYFEVSKVTSGTTNQNFYPEIEAINIPSDFNLVMTDNTYLRVFPNNVPKYVLLAVRDVSNVTITGGNLYGDRDDHDYSGGGTHEWGHVFALKAAVNVIIDGIYISNGSGDGIDISSLGFTFQPDYKPTNNIIIKNCVLDSNRRNNMSITDGFNITVIENEFLNASINTSFSTGIAPGFAMDIEAERTRDTNGDLVYYQIAKDIKILNNIERGSRKGAFTVFLGYDVLIEGNQTEKSISYSFGNGIKIRNNIITLNINNPGTTAIGGGREGGNETIYNNEISGNIISGYDTGINVKNRDTKVFGNTIKEFLTGIFPRDNFENSQIYDNTLTSSRAGSRGIFAFQINLNNIVINNNTINVKSNPIKFTRCNLSTEALNWNVVVKSNNTYSNAQILIEQSNNIDVLDNNFLQNVVVLDSKNINFSNNKITTNTNGFDFRNINNNINVKNNIINISNANSECIKISATTDPAEIIAIGNTCNN
tara:strand:- start:13763 stop:15706 length:1944 start_codon:yes stop_codon:yes gene_type:complete